MTDDPIQMSGPDLDEHDVEAVVSVLRSGTLGLGPQAREFERGLAEVAGTRHAVAVSSGTAGLHLIVRASGLGQGDDVLVPSFTFAASVNALLYEGVTPVFVDIESDTFNLDPAELRTRRTADTKGVMVVDVFGHPADWDAIERGADDLVLIDDCCEAIGARYRGRAAGSLGRAGCFAFYPNKQVTTGEGGAIVTDDEGLAERCRSLRNHGRGSMGGWLDHAALGFNYRMDEMSAALGVSQLARLDALLDKRARVAAGYTEMLSGLEWVQPPTVRPEVTMSWFVYVVMLAEGIDRDEVMRQMEADGIPTRAYFTPIHLQPYIRERFGDLRGMLPVTESVAPRVLALPFHNGLSRDEAARVITALKAAVAPA